MNPLSIILKLIQNPNVNEQLVFFANQTLGLIVPDSLPNNEDYRALRNQQITIEVEDLGLLYTLGFEDNSIQLLTTPALNPSLEIFTDSKAIQALVEKTQDLDELLGSKRIRFTGNSQLLMNLANLSVKIDYSVENVLAKYFGDVPAYFMNEFIKGATHVGKSFGTLVEGAHNREHYPETNEDAFRDDSLEAKARRRQERLDRQMNPEPEPESGWLADLANYKTTSDYGSPKVAAAALNSNSNTEGLDPGAPLISQAGQNRADVSSQASPKNIGDVILRELGSKFFPQDFNQLYEGIKFFAKSFIKRK